ncbi:hypothetical protein OEZ85_012621 [Tetradesmus obliquus]|uniref:Uncharacterized protein n=1 Tax=Tetradesmus obliquus TaxID=3088 RepID=A0ABY8U3N7_TETOB|nr:hypothetical protein OEZ85_012621 [Tetradesmus obliquus]
MRHFGSLCVLTALLISTSCYAEGSRTVLAGCKAGQGGKDCKPCGPGTFSAGGSFADCKSCDTAPNAFCLSMATPCQTKPPCDPATGKYSSMCWVPKADGAMCIVEGDMAGECKANICVDVVQGKPIGNLPQKTTPMPLPLPLPQKLPELGGQRPQVQPLGPTQQRPQVVPTGPTQQQPQVQPAKPACPSTPMCRSAATPCQQAPPCDAKGKPTSMCWVAKPAGAGCQQGGKSGKCSKDGQCVV